MESSHLSQSPQPSKSMQEMLASYKLPVATLKARNRKGELIDLFKARINAERIGTEYKQLNFLAVQNKVSHLTLLDLESFYKTCCESKSGFSRCFFGALKIKKQPWYNK